MTEEELKEVLKRNPGITIDGNNSNQRARTPTKLECGEAPEPLQRSQAKCSDTRRFVVRVTSVRKRLLDEDNICEKYIVDGLRYACLIPSDAPGTTSIKTGQRKTLKGEQEHTHIEIEVIHD